MSLLATVLFIANVLVNMTITCQIGFGLFGDRQCSLLRMCELGKCGESYVQNVNIN